MQRIFESHVTCPPVPEYLQARLNCSEMTNTQCIRYKPFITSSVIGNSLWMAMTKTMHWLRWTSKKQDTAWVWIMCYWYCNYENKLRVRITPPLAVVLFGSADRRFKSQRHILIWPVLSDSDASQRCHTSTREASALGCHSLVDFIHISCSSFKCSVHPFHVELLCPGGSSPVCSSASRSRLDELMSPFSSEAGSGYGLTVSPLWAVDETAMISWVLSDTTTWPLSGPCHAVPRKSHTAVFGNRIKVLVGDSFPLVKYINV